MKALIPCLMVAAFAVVVSLQAADDKTPAAKPAKVAVDTRPQFTIIPSTNSVCADDSCCGGPVCKAPAVKTTAKSPKAASMASK